MQISIDQIDFNKYKERTFKKHQEIILEKNGFKKFDNHCKQLPVDEAVRLCTNQMKPRLMFMSLIDFLKRKRIEVPTYYAIAEAITNAIKHYEETLLFSIKKHLSQKQKSLLDDLLELETGYLSEEKSDSKIKRYKITLLKKSNQSTKPSKIKENIHDLKVLKSLYKSIIYPIINQLNISPEITSYYAKLDIKSQVIQISRRDENRYLLLISFIIHQYYKLNDILVDILIPTCQTAINSSLVE